MERGNFDMACGAVTCGVVVKHPQHALACALFADVGGLVAAIGAGCAMLR